MQVAARGARSNRRTTTSDPAEQRRLSAGGGGRVREVSNAAKNILVVGGAGYLGSVLVPELLDRGCAVKVFDRLYCGNYLSKGVLDRIAFEVGDMRTISPPSLREVDAVINLGGLSNDPTAEYNPKANYEMNTIAAEKLARLWGEMDIRRYVLASSCSI